MSSFKLPTKILHEIWNEFEKNGNDCGICIEQPHGCYGAIGERFPRFPGRRAFQKTVSCLRHKWIMTYSNSSTRWFLQKMTLCVFCKNNREKPSVYNSHTVKTCPRLMNYICPTCGNTGHTLRYCPEKKVVTPEDVGLILNIENLRINWKSKHVFDSSFLSNFSKVCLRCIVLFILTILTSDHEWKVNEIINLRW